MFTIALVIVSLVVLLAVMTRIDSTPSETGKMLFFVFSGSVVEMSFIYFLLNFLQFLIGIFDLIGITRTAVIAIRRAFLGHFSIDEARTQTVCEDSTAAASVALAA